MVLAGKDRVVVLAVVAGRTVVLLVGVVRAVVGAGVVLVDVDWMVLVDVDRVVLAGVVVDLLVGAGVVVSAVVVLLGVGLVVEVVG